MIYFFNNDLGLEKVVTSPNILVGNHEHELNNLIRADVVLDLEHALSFIDDVDFFGYYYKDVFYLHKITRQETEHEAEVMVLAGRHIFFEDMLYSEVIKDIRPQNRDAKFMLDQAIGGHTRWNVVITDVTGTLSTNFYWQMPYEALEWIVEHFRLEYLPVILFDGQKINGYELHVKKRLGENKGIRIPWGERVEKLNYEIDFSEIVTQLAPRGKGEEIGEDIYSRRINISDVNFSRDGVVSPVGNLYLEDKSLTAKYGNDGGKPRKGEGEFYDIDDVNELAEAGYQMYLDVSRPQVVISADVVDIGDVTIGDGVNIIRREHDLYFEARVHKISVDLLNPDDAQIELGDYEHFKESKIQKSNKKRIEIIEKEVYGQIHQYKIEFDENFNSVVEQWREEQEQALIDVYAEIEASEQRHDDKWEQHEAEIDGNIERIVGGSLESLDTNLLDVNSRLLSKLEESDLQPLYGRIDDAFSDIINVSGDLDTARSELQEQLDDARAELEGIEVGGRNYIVPDSITSHPPIEGVSWTYDNNTKTFHGIIGNSSNRMYMNSRDFDARNLGVVTISGYFFINGSPFNMSDYRVPTRGEVSNIGTLVKRTLNEETGYFTETYENVTSNYILLSANRITLPENSEVSIKELKLEKGTIATDWTPAPEDTEAKITTLSESIEYIDGQLEAKLNRTEIEPIQNKITEYGTTLDANAESIGLLQDKTQLHDDDIEQWSNQATSTAEEVSRILTHNSEQDDLITSVTNESRETAEGLERTINRVSETESDISTAKADIIANADLIGATMTRVDGNDRAIGEFQATADGLKADFTRYQSDFGDDMSAIQSQVASYEANVDGFRADVGVLSKDVSSVESWQSEKGAVIDGNVDAIRTRIWQQDIDAVEVGGRNLILDSHNLRIVSGDGYSGILSFSNNENLIRIEAIGNKSTTANFYNTGFANLWNNKDEIFESISNGDEYTLSMEVRYKGSSRIRMGFDTRGVSSSEYARTEYITDTGEKWVKIYAVKKETNRLPQTQSLIIGWFDRVSIGDYIEIRNIKLEKGNKATDWTPAPEDIQSDITQLNTDITVEAGRINALLTRTSSAEKSIADINSSVDGITADFAKYKKDIDSDVGALSSQVASYEASVDGFRAEVGTLQGDVNDVDSWITKKGSIIDGNADAISARVWQQDITNAVDGIELGARNMLLGTDGETTINQSYKRWQIADGALYDHSGEPVTLSFEAKADTAGEIIRPYFSGDGYHTIDNIELTTEWKRYSVTFILDSENYNTVSFHTNGYGGATVFTGHVRRVKLEKGNKDTDWTLAPEDMLMKTDFILESDGFFLGGNYVGGDHYSTAIVGSRDGIDILADRMRVTGDLLVKGDVESYALSAVHGDITNLRSKLLTTNVVQSDHLNVGSALANKFNANTAFISRLEVQAANVRDLTGAHIRGGLLDSLNGNTRFNLNTGFLDMVNANFTLGGGASIHFNSNGNTITYERFDSDSGFNRTSGIGVGNAFNGRFPVIYMGTTGTGRGSFAANDDVYFNGFIANTNRRVYDDNVGNSVVGNLFQVRDKAWTIEKGYQFDLRGSRSSFSGINAHALNYDLGTSAGLFDNLYIRQLFTVANFEIRNNENTFIGWRMRTSESSGRVAFRGLNGRSYNYDLGESETFNHFHYGYINNLRGNGSGSSIGVSSNPYRYGHITTLTVHSNFWNNSLREYKENIHDLNLDDAIDFIRGNEVKVFNYKGSDEPSVGLIRDDLVGRDDLVANETAISPSNVQYIAQKVLKHEMYRNDEQDAEIQSNAEKIARLEKEIEKLKGA